MNETAKRGLLYGVGAALLGGLCYGGFVYKAEPDFMTLVGSANIQLRLAYGIPADDLHGEKLSDRIKLLDLAETNLARAKKQQPESPLVAEFEGFLARLRGDYREAAGHYHRARGLAECSVEQRETLMFNEARMLAESGDHAAALQLMQREVHTLSPEVAVQGAIERAGYLAELGRKEEARECLEPALASQEPVAWLQAGLCLEQIGDAQGAVAMFDKAKVQVPVAEYHMSRLKLAEGEVDTSLQLLERAIEAIPAEVRRLVREDPGAWQGLAENERFQQLTASAAAAPGR